MKEKIEFKEKFICPFCDVELDEGCSKKSKIKYYDRYIKKEVETVKQKPILIGEISLDLE